MSFLCHRHLLGYSIRWNNKNLYEQRNDVTQKYVNIWRLTCEIPIEVTISHKIVKEI